MRFVKALLLIIFVALSLPILGQAKSSGLDSGQVAPVEIGMGYAYFHANVPPSGCGCFSLNGGMGSVAINAPHGISLVADLSGAHAGKINGTVENITIFVGMVGPRYSYRSHSRFTPYVQGMLGGSKEYSNVANYQNASAFAVSGGVGVNAVLRRHWGWNVVEADYVYSRLPNGVNSYQNDLRLTTGVIFRFGSR